MKSRKCPEQQVIEQSVVPDGHVIIIEENGCNRV